MTTDLQEYLVNYPLSKFPQTERNGGKIVIVQHDASIPEAVRILSENNIYSAPVYDRTVSRFSGLIDFIDIADFVTEKFDKAHCQRQSLSGLIFKKKEILDTIKIDTIGTRGGFLPISVHSTLKDAVFLLAENQVHRVCVMDDEENVLNIISQSSVLAMISAYQLEGEDQTVEQLCLGTSPVVSVDVNIRTMDAFKVLRESKIYAAPIVSSATGHKEILSNISAKDIKDVCCNGDKMHFLYESLSVFLSARNSAGLSTRAPSFTVTGKNTIRDVIDKLVVNRIHRVYVINDQNAPISVITLTDIMRALA